MDLISVIVPVYKVEPYLDKCIQSIVDQTHRNLEIILVDDGSPDRCGEMCDAWAAKDSRIRVIHKENGGGAAARNTGLDIASGALIAFVDSDDFILPDMYQTLLEFQRTTGSDIAECGYFFVTSDEIPPLPSSSARTESFSTEEALRENIRDQVCRQLVWNKLYDRKTLDAVRFIEGKFIDDEFFTYRAIARAQKIAVTAQPLYCYRQQPGSAMHQTFSLKRLQAVEAKEYRLAFLAKHHPSLLPEARHNLWQTCLYIGQMSLLHLSREDRKTAFARLHAALAAHPLTAGDLGSLPLKRRVWPLLSRISFPLTCKLRNFLKKGI